MIDAINTCVLRSAYREGGRTMNHQHLADFALEHKMAAFDAEEIVGINTSLTKFVNIPHPIRHGFYGQDADHLAMGAAGFLGWRILFLCTEICIAKYRVSKPRFPNPKFRYAVFLGDGTSCVLVIKDLSLPDVMARVSNSLNAVWEMEGGRASATPC